MMLRKKVVTATRFLSKAKQKVAQKSAVVIKKKPKVKPKPAQSCFQKFDKTCVVCGIDFVSESDRGKYCGMTCANMAYNESRREKSPRKCVGCAGDIAASRKYKLYCSDDCKKKFTLKSVLDKQPLETCYICGKQYKHTRKKQTKTCSRECIYKHNSLQAKHGRKVDPKGD